MCRQVRSSAASEGSLPVCLPTCQPPGKSGPPVVSSISISTFPVDLRSNGEPERQQQLKRRRTRGDARDARPRQCSIQKKEKCGRYLRHARETASNLQRRRQPGLSGRRVGLLLQICMRHVETSASEPYTAPHGRVRLQHRHQISL